jgi:16S rRNA (adenine1518-N6/adenine1519-N6)-dimethyltransferase
MHTKKSLGQHFLHVRQYAERLISAIDPDVKNVVEVGPGPGMLTGYLVNLSHLERILLVEKDTHLASALAIRYAPDPRITVVEADFLDFDLLGFWGDQSFLVVGNFPYNISSQIVFKILDIRDSVPGLIGMFQYEMARRIIAGPGSKEYGVISVLTATTYRGVMLYKVPPGAFHPPPKVDSAVIKLVRKGDYSLPCRYHSLRVVVKAAFGQRRKMLRNSLKGLIPDLSSPFFEKRPEQVTFSDFIDLALQFEQMQQDGVNSSV